MPSDSSNLGEFLAAFRGHWLGAMSGAFSVPFAGAGVLFASGGIWAGAAIFTALAIAAAWFAAYSLWKIERDRYAVILNEFSHCLRLDAVDCRQDRQLDPSNPAKTVKREIQFLLQWKNTINRPVRYETLRVRVDGIDTHISNSFEVISALSPATFYVAPVPAPVSFGTEEGHSILVEVAYGPADMPPTRRIKKSIYAVIDTAVTGSLSFLYLENTDEPVLKN